MTAPQPDGPLARRDRIRQQRDAAYEIYSSQAVARQQSEQARTTTENNLRGMEVRAASGSATDADVEKLRNALTRIEADEGTQARRASRALDVVKAADSKLAQVYSEGFAVFADEAENVSQAAEAAIKHLAAAYRKATAAWEQAAEAWRPLCIAAGIENVGGFPVPEFELLDVLRGECNPRPRQVEVSEELDEELTT